jgi:hypothetical protein
MEELAAVAYASIATRPLGARDLDTLLIDARAFNERVQVTGALLHHEGAFFQYFEGAPAAVVRVYDRIKRSTLHTSLSELLNQPIESRQFTHWHMAFCEATTTVLGQLSNEYWAMTLPRLHQRQVHSRGLALLLNFWETARHGRAVISDLPPPAG